MLFENTCNDWQLKLISLFCWIDDGFTFRGWDLLCERFSPNRHPSFTDTEVLSSYLFARMRGHHCIKSAWQFIADFLLVFFPKLPSYSTFVARLHRLIHVLEKALIECTQHIHIHKYSDYIIDSCPLIVGKGPRSNSAKVASELSDKSYSSTKRIWYYGIKLHVVVRRRPGVMPKPVFMGIGPASEHDNRALKELIGCFDHGKLFGDKAYGGQDFAQQLKEQGSQLCVPSKRGRGQFQLAGTEVNNLEVSQIRQSVETYFAWLHEKTNIQNAGKVRSLKGLLTFVWSSLLVGMLLFPS